MTGYPGERWMELGAEDTGLRHFGVMVSVVIRGRGNPPWGASPKLLGSLRSRSEKSTSFLRRHIPTTAINDIFPRQL